MRYVTYAKDGYIGVIDWIEAHPHYALWIGVAAVAGALFV